MAVPEQLQFFASCPSAAYVKDTEGRYLLANAAFLALVGRSAQEVLGRRDEDLFPPAVADHYRWADEHVQTSGRPWLTDEPAGRGERRTHLILRYPLRDDSGAIVGVAGVVNDITVRRREEERLARSEANLRAAHARLESILANMEEGVVMADADDVVIAVNDWFCRFIGRGRDELVGQKLGRFHDVAVLERVRAQVELARSGQRVTVSLERRIHDRDVILRLQPILCDGRYDGMLLNVIDVSELVAARRHAEEALSRVRTLEGLVSICMHCHRIHVGADSWEKLESYLVRHSHARLSHGLCPSCLDQHYPDDPVAEGDAHPDAAETDEHKGDEKR